MAHEKRLDPLAFADTAPQTSTSDFDCLRCALILTGRSPETAPEHSHRCAFRDTGHDPAPDVPQIVAPGEEPAAG
jgi:hypothetical protein